MATIALTAAPLMVNKSRHEQADSKFDLTSTVLTTASLSTLIFTIIHNKPSNWNSAKVLNLLNNSIILLTAFLLIKSRSPNPLIPLQLFQLHELNISALTLTLNDTTFLNMFFLTALYLQQVHNNNALKTNLQFVPMKITAILSTTINAQLVTHYNTQITYLTNTTISVINLLLLTQVNTSTSYTTNILPKIVVFDLNLPLVNIANQIATIAEMPHSNTNATSNIITTTFQINNALKLTIISTTTTSHTNTVLTNSTTQPQTLTKGFQRGLYIATNIALLNLLINTIRTPRITPDETTITKTITG